MICVFTAGLGISLQRERGGRIPGKEGASPSNPTLVTDPERGVAVALVTDPETDVAVGLVTDPEKDIAVDLMTGQEGDVAVALVTGEYGADHRKGVGPHQEITPGRGAEGIWNGPAKGEIDQGPEMEELGRDPEIGREGQDPETGGEGPNANLSWSSYIYLTTTVTCTL